MAEVVGLRIELEGFEQVASNLSNLEGAARELRRQIKDIDFEQDPEGFRKLQQELGRVNNALKQYRDEQRRVNREVDAADGSIVALRTQLSRLTRNYDRLSKAEREAGQEGRDLRREIQRITKELKDAEGATGRFQRNVGNYPDAFAGFTGAIEGGVESLTSFKAIGAAAIATIVEIGRQAARQSGVFEIFSDSFSAVVDSVTDFIFSGELTSVQDNLRRRTTQRRLPTFQEGIDLIRELTDTQVQQNEQIRDSEEETTAARLAAARENVELLERQAVAVEDYARRVLSAFDISEAEFQNILNADNVEDIRASLQAALPGQRNEEIIAEILGLLAQVQSIRAQTSSEIRQQVLDEQRLKAELQERLRAEQELRRKELEAFDESVEKEIERQDQLTTNTANLREQLVIQEDIAKLEAATLNAGGDTETLADLQTQIANRRLDLQILQEQQRRRELINQLAGAETEADRSALEVQIEQSEQTEDRLRLEQNINNEKRDRAELDAEEEERISRIQAEVERIALAFAGLSLGTPFDPVIQQAGLLAEIIKLNGTEAEKLAQGLAVVAQAAGAASQIIADNSARRIEEIEAEFDARIEAAEGYTQVQEELSQRREELIRQEQRKAARQQKALAIFQAVIATARAVAQALPAIPLAVAVGALGAAQIALIAAQPLPQFKHGGLLKAADGLRIGEVQRGPSHGQGGIPAVAFGRAIEVEGGEFADYDEFGNLAIINKRSTAAYSRQLRAMAGKQFKGKSQMLAAINAKYGSMWSGLPEYFKTGGIMLNPNLNPALNASFDTTGMYEAILNGSREGTREGLSVSDLNRERERERLAREQGVAISSPTTSGPRVASITSSSGVNLR